MAWRVDECEKTVWVDILKSGITISHKEQVREDVLQILISLVDKTTKVWRELDEVKQPMAWEMAKQRISKLVQMMKDLRLNPDKVTREFSLLVNMKSATPIDVWNAYIGPSISTHRCLCCKKSVISTTDFEVGYAISKENGGVLEIGNLRPICSLCRHAMGASNMVDFVQKYGYFIG